MALFDKIDHFYRMEEASGSALDEAGTNDLTDNNTCGTAAGVISNSRQILGITNNEYFSHSADATFSLSASEWGVSLWFKRDSAMSAPTGYGRGIVSYHNSDAVGDWTIAYHEGNVYVYHWSSSGADSDGRYRYTGTPLDNGNFNHIVATMRSGTGLVVKVNNSTVTLNDRITSDSGWGSAGLAVGSLWTSGGANYATDGYVDLFGISLDEQFTDQDITDLYDGGSGWNYVQSDRKWFFGAH